MDKISGKSNITINKSVTLGFGSVIEQGAIIGLPPFNKQNGELKTIIGKNAYIRANTIIYAGVKIGDNFQTGSNVLIRENNIIGDNVVIWHGSTINPDNCISDGSRIHAGCFLEKVTLGKQVFVGPHVVFTDDPHPINPINYKECWNGAEVGDNAVIGGNVTLLPGVKIGKSAVVGAGSVVTKDIPAYQVAVGNPAKIIKNISNVTRKRSGKTHYPYKHIKQTI